MSILAPKQEAEAVARGSVTSTVGKGVVTVTPIGLHTARQAKNHLDVRSRDMGCLHRRGLPLCHRPESWSQYFFRHLRSKRLEEKLTKVCYESGDQSHDMVSYC
jgi:hypothetical protein